MQVQFLLSAVRSIDCYGSLLTSVWFTFAAAFLLQCQDFKLRHDSICILHVTLCKCCRRTLEDRVREYEIFDLRDFYMSNQFSKAEFQLDQGAGLITRHRSQ